MGIPILMKTISVALIAFLFLFGSQSCKKKIAELEYQERGTIIESSNNGHIPKSEIADKIDFSTENVIEHGVTYYSITYRTEFQGKQIDSRGLLLVPDDVDSAYFITYFHGTHIPVNLSAFYQSKKETPSNYDGSGGESFLETRNIALAWASAGYVVFMPDYIGFGITKEKEHPYLAYDELFKSNIDGILAAKEFISRKGLAYDNRLFLAGWSQGGGACLSAHKFIQEQYASEFTVVASSGLAGPYNFRGFIDDILSKKDEELNINGIFSWGLYSLNKFSPELRRPTDQLYSYPVYDQNAAIFTPSRIPSQTMREYFLAHIIDGSDAAMNQVINRNTFSSGWTPVGKVFFHHGDADQVVYYFNSEDAYNGLGAAGGDVTLYTYQGGTHTSEVPNYMANTLNDFNDLK